MSRFWRLNKSGRNYSSHYQEGTMIILQKKWFMLAGLMLCTAVILGACNSLPWASAQEEPTPVPVVPSEGVVSAEGRLIPRRSSALGFLSGGELGELPVTEGDTVSQGDILASLGKLEPLEASLSQAQMELLSAQQALDELNDTADLSRQQANQALVEARTRLNQAQMALNDLDTEDFQEELDDRNIAVQDAKEELDNTREDLVDLQDLDPDNARRKDAQTAYDDALRAYNEAIYDRNDLKYQLDNAQAAVDLASARLEDARRLFDNRKDGVDLDTLSLAQARLEFAAAQVASTQRALDNADLTAPFDGILVDMEELEPGESVLPGQVVVTLADYSTWMVETQDLTELDVVKVEIGQDVMVTPDALPDLELAGTVESIDRIFTERSGDVLYTVRIRLDESNPRLRWGMTVNAVFEP